MGAEAPRESRRRGVAHDAGASALTSLDRASRLNASGTASLEVRVNRLALIEAADLGQALKQAEQNWLMDQIKRQAVTPRESKRSRP